MERWAEQVVNGSIVAEGGIEGEAEGEEGGEGSADLGFRSAPGRVPSAGMGNSGGEAQ